MHGIRCYFVRSVSYVGFLTFLCRAGRTGLVVVCALVALGVDPSKAIDITREARDGMIQNPAQILYVRAFRAAWRKRMKGMGQIGVSESDEGSGGGDVDDHQEEDLTKEDMEVIKLEEEARVVMIEDEKRRKVKRSKNDDAD